MKRVIIYNTVASDAGQYTASVTNSDVRVTGRGVVELVVTSKDWSGI